VRILAFSDLHCNSEAATEILHVTENADVVVGAGDFGICGERTVELLEILKEIPIPVLLVSGNHNRQSELTSYCSSQNNLFCLDASTPK